jgi:hypothetical protein
MPFPHCLGVSDARWIDGQRLRRSAPAAGADAGQLDGTSVESEAQPAAEILRSRRNAGILGLDGRPAASTDQHLAWMRMVRHGACDKGLGALEAVHQAVIGKELEAAIYAGGRS